MRRGSSPRRTHSPDRDSLCGESPNRHYETSDRQEPPHARQPAIAYTRAREIRATSRRPPSPHERAPMAPLTRCPVGTTRSGLGRGVARAHRERRARNRARARRAFRAVRGTPALRGGAARVLPPLPVGSHELSTPVATIAFAFRMASELTIASATTRCSGFAGARASFATQWEASPDRWRPAGPVGFSGGGGLTLFATVDPWGSDRLSLCRPSPTEDRRRDLIGACQSPTEWCPPVIRFVSHI
jgi:hypothetical protein